MTQSHSSPEPRVTDHTLPGRDDDVLRFRGRLLGFSSSRWEDHNHPVSYDSGGRLLSFAPPNGRRCSACRWFEVRIFDVSQELTDAQEELDRRGHYLVLTAGKTVVPGEVEMRRAEWTDSAYEVIELLTQRRRDDDGVVDRAFLPAPSARVLSQAAAWDEGIREAYVNRAVV